MFIAVVVVGGAVYATIALLQIACTARVLNIFPVTCGLGSDLVSKNDTKSSHRIGQFCVCCFLFV